MALSMVELPIHAPEKTLSHINISRDVRRALLDVLQDPKARKPRRGVDAELDDIEERLRNLPLAGDVPILSLIIGEEGRYLSNVCILYVDIIKAKGMHTYWLERFTSVL
ncbi:hypothetical protein BV25DRAFT_1920478 [Artomyces pyxidatus]|uniref:Uncharacterized protein n=1 Tax=Artomyces pyxidatus TaxID=48021 RepID=A0ACB8SL97_9AGAM|nr:hypothetical protein BV25DRAFT_1920478 [Artomyces pyxidatus]